MIQTEQALPQASTHKNRRSLLLLLAVFILPVVLAKLALDNQWLSLGVTNQGKLITEPLTLAELGLDGKITDKKWQIIYRLPNECSELCLHSIETVHNSYVALGKYMPRVSAVLLKEDIFSVQQNEQLAKSQWQILSLSAQMHRSIPNPQVLIADPLGNVILQHSIPETEAQQNSFGKAIIADMKKLLKYSKVG
ncbi:hypothetical protein [Colwellia sp. E2M01]|uniref:hypothetical protein n=1 Tax=Colwellia sp. E2M01 TaxID=2841561 RepID=UPI001C09D488|nr:hypothetical protein [Colwellia sp. E2M01]MBU2869526.1 hypothetical protein [Colwellia sp. E2M01]